MYMKHERKKVTRAIQYLSFKKPNLQSTSRPNPHITRRHPPWSPIVPRYRSLHRRQPDLIPYTPPALPPRRIIGPEIVHRQVRRVHGHPRPIRGLEPGTIIPRPGFHMAVDGDLIPVARGLVTEILERQGEEVRRAILRGRVQLRAESRQLSVPVVQEQHALRHEIGLVDVAGRVVAAVDVAEDVPAQEIVDAFHLLDLPGPEGAEEGVLFRDEGFPVVEGAFPRGGAETAWLVEEQAVEVVAPEGAAEAVGFRGEEGQVGGGSILEEG